MIYRRPLGRQGVASAATMDETIAHWFRTLPSAARSTLKNSSRTPFRGQILGTIWFSTPAFVQFETGLRTITLREFTETMETLGLRLHSFQYEILFKRCDTRHRGRIDAHQFAYFLQHTCSSIAAEPPVLQEDEPSESEVDTRPNSAEPRPPEHITAKPEHQHHIAISNSLKVRETNLGRGMMTRASGDATVQRSAAAEESLASRGPKLELCANRCLPGSWPSAAPTFLTSCLANASATSSISSTESPQLQRTGAGPLSTGTPGHDDGRRGMITAATTAEPPRPSLRLLSSTCSTTPEESVKPHHNAKSGQSRVNQGHQASIRSGGNQVPDSEGADPSHLAALNRMGNSHEEAPHDFDFGERTHSVSFLDTPLVASQSSARLSTTRGRTKSVPSSTRKLTGTSDTPNALALAAKTVSCWNLGWFLKPGVHCPRDTTNLMPASWTLASRRLTPPQPPLVTVPLDLKSLIQDVPETQFPRNGKASSRTRGSAVERQLMRASGDGHRFDSDFRALRTPRRASTATIGTPTRVRPNLRPLTVPHSATKSDRFEGELVAKLGGVRVI